MEQIQATVTEASILCPSLLLAMLLWIPFQTAKPVEEKEPSNSKLALSNLPPLILLPLSLPLSLWNPCHALSCPPLPLPCLSFPCSVLLLFQVMPQLLHYLQVDANTRLGTIANPSVSSSAAPALTTDDVFRNITQEVSFLSLILSFSLFMTDPPSPPFSPPPIGHRLGFPRCLHLCQQLRSF
jgi:hypothetical protein